jgi:hypothetical protein
MRNPFKPMDSTIRSMNHNAGVCGCRFGVPCKYIIRKENKLEKACQKSKDRLKGLKLEK